MIAARRLWGKGVESFRVGLQKIEDKVNLGRLEESPIFVAKTEKLNEIEGQLTSLLSAITVFLADIRRIDASFPAVASAFAAPLSGGEDAVHDHSVHFKSCTASVAQLIDNAVRAHIPEQVVTPLQEISNEIVQLKHIREKRYKNHVLLTAATQKLERARAKGKDVSALEAEETSRRMKFDRRTEQYYFGVGQLAARQAELFGQIMHAFQFYTLEMIEQLEKRVSNKMLSFPYCQMQGTIPSITIAPDI
jgi:hypothetical protein